MYASIDFATKKDFRLAVQQGCPMMLFSPTLGMPAVNGKVTVMGPWPGISSTPAPPPPYGPQLQNRKKKLCTWKARAVVKDGRVVQVH